MLENDLRNETQKWLKKIVIERKKIILLDEKRKDMLKNIDAYISDSKHFLEKKDMIRAFEAVIYAYGMLDAVLEAKILQTKSKE